MIGAEVVFTKTEKSLPLVPLDEKEIKEIIETCGKYFPTAEEYKKWKQEEKALEDKY